MIACDAKTIDLTSTLDYRPDRGEAIKRLTRPSRSSPHPHARQPVRAELGVSDCVPDISMAQKIPNEPGVQLSFCQHVAGRMSEHVGMDAEPNASDLSGLADEARRHVRTDRSAAFANEYERAVGDLPQLPQASDLIAVEGVAAVFRSFDPPDVEGLLAGIVEVELGPARQPGFLGPQAVAIYHSE